MADDVSENAGSHDPCPEVMSGVLRDGFYVVIRPLRTSDRNQLAGGFLLLSERSRYLRFLTGVDHLSDSDLDVLIDQVDQHNHVALAMFWQRAAQPDLPLSEIQQAALARAMLSHPPAQRDLLVGVGRFIRLPENPTTADVAVTIADELQGQGGGRLLMAALVKRAREEGVTKFTATMANSNEASYRMLASAGTVTRDNHGSGMRELGISLSPN